MDGVYISRDFGREAVMCDTSDDQIDAIVAAAKVERDRRNNPDPNQWMTVPDRRQQPDNLVPAEHLRGGGEPWRDVDGSALLDRDADDALLDKWITRHDRDKAADRIDLDD